MALWRRLIYGIFLLVENLRKVAAFNIALWITEGDDDHTVHIVRIMIQQQGCFHFRDTSCSQRRRKREREYSRPNPWKAKASITKQRMMEVAPNMVFHVHMYFLNNTL